MSNTITFGKAWEQHYPDKPKPYRLYEEVAGKGASWDTLSLSMLDLYVRYLKGKYAVNTAKTYCAMMKALLNLHPEKHNLPKGYDKLLSISKEGTIMTWLTDEEIELFASVYVKSIKEDVVKQRFLLGCLTGARHSDYMRFGMKNIIGDKLCYVSQKTGIRSEIPLSPLVKKILLSNLFSKSVCMNTRSEFNDIVKRLAKRAGITSHTMIHHGGQDKYGEKWEMLSSHTARRSFATNLYLRCHDIFMVSRYMGHSDVSMTAHYILDIGEAPQEVKEFFNRFK